MWRSLGEINNALVDGFHDDIGGIILHDAFEFFVDKDVFVWLGLGKNQVWAECLGLHAAHANFDAARLRFVAGGNNACVRRDAVGDGDWVPAQHWAGLLFDGSETRVEVDIKDIIHSGPPRILDTS